MLRNHDFIVKQSDVVAAVIDDRPGGLTAVLQILSGAQVSVEYMYAFVGNQDGHAVVVMRTDNAETALQALATTRFNPGPKRYLPTVICRPARLPFSGRRAFFLTEG